MHYYQLKSHAIAKLLSNLTFLGNIDDHVDLQKLYDLSWKIQNAENISLLTTQTNISRPEKITLSPALYSRRGSHNWNAHLYYVYNYGLQLTMLEPRPAIHTGKYTCQAIPKHPQEEKQISTPSLAAEIDINIMNGKS